VRNARSGLTSDVPPATNISSRRPGKKRTAGPHASCLKLRLRDASRP
jgi:hypothetical protein